MPKTVFLGHFHKYALEGYGEKNVFIAYEGRICFKQVPMTLENHF